MSYFPESVIVELLTYVDGLATWTNISDRVESDIKVQTGFTDAGPLNRLAPGGDMRFDIGNRDSAYNPSSTFYKGQKIRLRVKYGSLPQTKFFGYIDTIKVDVGTVGPQRVHVVAIDWLAMAAKTPVRAIEGMTNTTIDLAVARLISQMQIQPEETDFEVGNITLPTVFDQVTPNSTVYSELQNLVMAEWGYIYLRDGGETLKVENSISRTGIGQDYQTFNYYLNDGIAEDFLLEDGTNFLLEDGTNFLLEGEPTSASFNSDFDEEYTNVAINHGDNLVNKISASAIPVVIGGAPAVIYPFDIANGSKAILVPTNSQANPFIVQGQYKDPTAGGTQISGTSIITPVLTTDWRFNSNADGTGTDLSANITITWKLGQSGFKAQIANTGIAGYITKFNIRGTPVYRYAPVETVFQDQGSIWHYGDFSLQFTRQYGESSDAIQPYLFRLLMRDKQPRTIVSNPKFNAFDTQDHLAGFLALDIGDQIRLASTKPGTDALYYIQGVRFTIQKGSEVIKYDYITAETLSWQPEGFTEVALQTAVLTAIPTGINFGYLSYISNLSVRSICFRAKIISDATSSPIYICSYGVLVDGVNDVESVRYWDNGTGTTYYIEYKRMGADGTTATWRRAVSAPDNAWHDYVIMYDQRNKDNVPLFYIDGVLSALTSGGGWTSGAAKDESGLEFSVVSNPQGVAVIENVAVYSRFLSTDEIATITNGGTRLPFASYPVNNLLFFMGMMNDADYAARLNSALLPTDQIIDALTGSIGAYKTGAVITLKAVG